jgi:hypothetical protein
MTGEAAANFMRLATGEAAPLRAAFFDREGVHMQALLRREKRAHRRLPLLSAPC